MIVGIFIFALGVLGLGVVAAVGADSGQWRSTGAWRTDVTSLKNGWRREQRLYEQVDVAKEGRTRWVAIEEHDDISPTGIKVNVDRRDYGM